jgi:Fic family protein
VLKAGVAHLWFVTIHPFDDGNGRIARAIADMVLAGSERRPQRFYSMSAQIREERKELGRTLCKRADRTYNRWEFCEQRKPRRICGCSISIQFTAGPRSSQGHCS